MKNYIRSTVRRLGPYIRSGTASLLYRSGVTTWKLRAAMQDRALVLMYHRVLPTQRIPNSPSHPGIIVSTATFEMHMRAVRERFQVLTPEQFAGCIEERLPFPPMSCMVTFDDGWQDNLEHALPILQKYDIRPLIFLAAGFVGTDRRFWQESMTGAILDARLACRADPGLHTRIEADPELAGIAPLLAGADGPARDAVSRFVPAWKSQPRTAIDAWVRRLESHLPDAAEPEGRRRHFLNWEEVQTMQKAGVVFGSHGLDHRILTLGDTDARHEIGESGRLIQERLGRPVEFFSYPNGNCDEAIASLVREAGYRLAFSTRRGHVGAGDDRFLLKRNNIYDGGARTLPMFLARILGIW